MTVHPPSPLTTAAVLFVADVSRVARFYQEIMEMAVVHSDDRHTVLESRGFELTIHAMRMEDGASTSTETDVVAREDSYVKLCFPVADISAARARAHALGGAVRPESDEWETRVFRACDGHDPEGNIVQLRMAVS